LGCLVKLFLLNQNYFMKEIRVKKKPKSIIGLIIGLIFAAALFWLKDKIGYDGDVPFFFVVIGVLGLFFLLLTIIAIFFLTKD
jgi:hypothetical protein